MEERAGADHVLLPNQCDAAVADNLFEILEGLEIGIDQRLVHKLPEVLGGLHLGAVRRLKHEPDAVWDCQGPCHPALSICSTMRLLLPAPADLAKSKRIASNISFSGALPHGALLERLQTAFETFQTVAPVAGSTKPQT
jgi:hypothetical protein